MGAILNFSKKLGVELPIINAAINVNESQPIIAVKEVRSLLGNLKGKRIAILGLSFKPNTDDMREAISLKIIDEFRREGAKIIAYDPKAMENAKNILGKRIFFANSVKECIENAECCIIVTEWDEFKRIKPEEFKKHMSRPLIMDGRRIYNPKEFSKKLEYHAVGLGNL
jgi:UDPglucose 6-dehydrogenase